MGLREQQRAMPATDPEAAWRQRVKDTFLATLGSRMMASPDPRAIGAGFAEATDRALAMRQEALAAREAERERQLSEAYRQEQIEGMRADRLRADAEAQAERERQRLALRSREQLIEELAQLSPDDLELYESDPSVKPGDIRARILDVRKAQAEAAEPDEVSWQHVEQNGRFYALNPKTLETRPLGGIPLEVKETTPSKPYEEPILTPYQVEQMISGRVQAGLAANAKAALEQIQRDTPPSVLPPSYRPRPVAPPPSPPPARSVGASALPPAGRSVGASGIGASAAAAETVTVRGKAIPLDELVAEARAERNPEVARRTLGALGLPAGTVELIVRRAYPVAAR